MRYYYLFTTYKLPGNKCENKYARFFQLNVQNRASRGPNPTLAVLTRVMVCLTAWSKRSQKSSMALNILGCSVIPAFCFRSEIFSEKKSKNKLLSNDGK